MITRQLTIFIALFTTLFICNISLAGDRPEVSKYAHSYTSDWKTYSVVVTAVRIGPKKNNEYIVKLSGIEHELDGKIFKYKKEAAGTGYNLVRNKENFFAMRKRWNEYEDYEIYLDNDTIKLSANSSVSKTVNTKHFLTEYLTQKK